VLGQDYPFPLSEHSWARERVLQVYRNAKNAAKGD
jgi:hypothetical protein